MCVSGDLFLATKVLITIQSLLIRKLCKYLAAVTQLVGRSAFTSPSVGPGEQFRSQLSKSGTGLIKLSAVEQTIMHTTQQQRSTRLLLPLEFLIHSSPAESSDPSLLFFPILLSEPTAILATLPTSTMVPVVWCRWCGAGADWAQAAFGSKSLTLATSRSDFQ
jgi:hypothetical protein